MDAGIDSLAGAELGSRLNSEFNTDLPATVLFDFPSVKAIAEHLAVELGPSLSVT